MTNKKRPKVKIVAGNVNKISSGFTIASSTANTNATITAVKILLFTIAIPGKIAASIKTFTVVIRILYKKFMMLILSFKDNGIID
jgi:hypothetical protein